MRERPCKVIWIPCTADEATAIIEACRAEIDFGTLPVERALDLAKAYDRLKRAPVAASAGPDRQVASIGGQWVYADEPRRVRAHAAGGVDRDR